MPGEPEGVFDATQLQLIETDALGVQHPSHIVDVGESFFLSVKIEGTPGDPNWDNFKNTNAALTNPADGFFAHVRFYAEGMGPGVPNKDFGNASLRITTDELMIRSSDISVADEGIYRCGVMARVNLVVGTIEVPWSGWLAFNEECVIEVNPFET